MKFKVDENLPVEVESDLRSLGYDAKTVYDQLMMDIDDQSLLHVVVEETPVFLTMDKGIANVRVYSPTKFSGLVLFRPSNRGRGSVRMFVRKSLPRVLVLDLAERLIVVNEAGF